VIIWANDRRRAQIPDPYDDVADDEISPLEMSDTGTGADHSSLN